MYGLRRVGVRPDMASNKVFIVGKMKNLFLRFMLCVFFVLAVQIDLYADSKIGIAISSKTMAVRKFSDISGKESNSPAKKAGLLEGDIVKEINESAIGSVQDFANVMKNIPPDTVIPVKIERNGKEKIFKVKTKKNHTPEVGIISGMLIRGENLSLAIVIGSISNTMASPNHAGLNEWKNTMRTQLQTEVESVYVQYSKVFKNFSLVDRDNISSILEELNFQASDYASENTRLKIGEITGATHLLVVDFSRTVKEQYSHTDMITKRLLDIETGEILSSAIIYQYYNSSGKLQKIE